MLVMSLSASGISPGVDISKFTWLVSRAGPQDYASVPSLQYSQKVLGSSTHAGFSSSSENGRLQFYRPAYVGLQECPDPMLRQ
jgi:hypothetical protein